MPKSKSSEKEMLGGCCVCADDRGWTENPLVYCDGDGCNVAVHQACYGIVTIPTTNWYCRKCETPDLDQVKCELCPSSIGALKPTDSRGWAHVVCALYIPEVSFGNVTTMEPIIINQVPQERFNKTCYICEEGGKGAVARIGACMQCNRSGCRQVFHVTCAQAQGLLCEEAGNYQDNVKYCGYCHHHYNKLKKGSHVKTIPPYRPVSSGDEIHDDEHHKHHTNSAKRKYGSSGGGKVSRNESMGGGDGENQSLHNGDSPELSKTSSTSVVGISHISSINSTSVNKKRKSNRSSTPVVMQSDGGDSSPRPHTPAAPTLLLRPISPSNNSTAPPVTTAQTVYNSTTASNGGVSKVGSIVVQVPLEAAGVGGGTSPAATLQPSPHHPSLPSSTSPPPPNPSENSSTSSHPVAAKRSRSESSDKGEKRRSKRSSGSGSSAIPSSNPTRSQRKSSPPSSRVKSSPEPVNNAAPIVKSTTPTLTLSSSISTTIIKEEKDIKLYENGVGAAHMLGNQLAPGSSMADTLSQEVAAHSIYSRPSASTHVGPHFPRPTPYRGPGSSSGGGGGLTAPWGSSSSNMPQTLEQLLERQWEQGSQFLMEQAHHFDIASLLSCLHQLKAENAQLEEHVNSLQARRDNLLAVNARLAIPLVTPSHHPSTQGGGNNVSGTGRVSTSSGTGGVVTSGSSSNATLASAVLSNTSSSTPPIVENGLPAQHHDQQYRLSTPLHRVESHRSVSGANVYSGQGGGSSGSGSGSGSSSSTMQQQASSIVVRSAGTPSTAASQPPSSSQPRSGSSSSYAASSFSSTNSQVVVRRSGETDQHKPGAGS